MWTFLQKNFDKFFCFIEKVYICALETFYYANDLAIHHSMKKRMIQLIPLIFLIFVWELMSYIYKVFIVSFIV